MAKNYKRGPSRIKPGYKSVPRSANRQSAPGFALKSLFGQGPRKPKSISTIQAYYQATSISTIQAYYQATTPKPITLPHVSILDDSKKKE